MATTFGFRVARPARVSPRGESADGPRSTHALVDFAWLSSRSTTRSTPRRWLRLLRTDTAPGRRLRIRNFVATVFRSRAARPARASLCGEPADRPRNTRSAARIWRSCVVGQRGARCSPRRRPGLERINITTGQRHGLRAFLTTAFKSRAARPVRFPSRGVSADLQRSTRRAVRTWRGCVVGQRRARLPTPSAGAHPHQHRDRSVAGNLKGINQHV